MPAVSAAAPASPPSDRATTARRALAVVLALHGLAHFAGTGDALSTAADGTAKTYLTGAWSVADPTVLRAFAAAWALVALAFVVTAIATWMGRPEWPRLLRWVALASLIVVAVGLWSSVVGMTIDIVLLVVAGWASARSGSRSHR